MVIQDEQDRSSTPAVEATPEAMSPTVLNDCELNAQEEDTSHDSFVHVIDTRSPAKFTPGSLLQDKSDPQVAAGSKTDTDMAAQLPQTNEDSFVEQIVARSPAKPVMRIEDCVEAIDAFEDEIEKVGEQIPNIDNPATAAKVRKPRKAVEARPQKTQRNTAKKPASLQVEERGNSKRQSQAPANQSASTRPPKIRVSSIHKPPFQPMKSSKPPTVSSFELPGEAVARKLKEQREQRLQQEENGATAPKRVERVQAPKVRSTKPPTRPSFELPGEAVARKLKEQREERLRQQELAPEAEEKELKTRSARLSQSRAVRSTATVGTRMSLVKGGAAGEKNARRPSSGSRPAAVKRASTLAPVEASKRMSSHSTAERKSSVTANSRARQSLLDAAKSRLSSAAAPHRAGSNGKNVPHSTRGKEVFERTKTAKEERDRLKRDKEEAAKKARAEAAERGRIASRQWAEKQKARKSSA